MPKESSPRASRLYTMQLAKPITIRSKQDQYSYTLDGKEIPIHAQHVYEYSFPVKPLDEEWLLSEATLEEQCYLIDGWIDEQIQALRDTKTRTARRYNLLKKIPTETERFLAYAEIVEEYQMKRDEYMMSDNPSAIDKADQAQEIQDLVVAKFIREFGAMSDRGPALDLSHLPQFDAPSIYILLTETDLYMQRIQYEALRRAV